MSTSFQIVPPFVNHSKRQIISEEESQTSLKKPKTSSFLHRFINELDERKENLSTHIRGSLIQSYKTLYKYHISAELDKAALQERLNKGLDRQMHILEDWLNRLQPFSMLFQAGRKKDDRQLQYPQTVSNPMKRFDSLVLDSPEDFSSLKAKYIEVSETVDTLLYQIRQVNLAFALLQGKSSATIAKRIWQLVKEKPTELWLFSKVENSLSS